MHAIVRSDCSKCVWKQLLQSTRSSQHGQNLVLLPSPVQCVMFALPCHQSEAQWRLHEGAPKNLRGSQNTLLVSGQMREFVCTSTCQRSCVTGSLAEQVVLLGSAREKTSHHSAKLFERELPAWVILVNQDLLQLWTGRHQLFQSLGSPIESATPGQITSRGFLISGTDRCAAGFARRQLWMKVR